MRMELKVIKTEQSPTSIFRNGYWQENFIEDVYVYLQPETISYL